MAPDEDDLGLPDWYDAVYAAVRAIPKGKAATYGQIAGVVTGVAVTARQVGAALRCAPADVPWQRVVGAGGRLPIAKRSPELKLLQRRLLAEEGVIFSGTEPDHVDMATAQWLSESACQRES
jgi:methylated-DNA-protein-cysteine methyltransferase-like protein